MDSLSLFDKVGESTPIYAMIRSFAPTLLFCLIPWLTSAQTRKTGELNGAQFIIDVPANPHGDVLFLARGYRPETFPLSAIYEEETTFFQTLQATGWTIASTSFQGNRWVMAGGGADLVALYDNLYTNFVMADLAALNITLGDTFTLTHGTVSVEVTFAQAYSDVPRGEWVAFIDPEGYLQISRNYAHAAETLGAQKGDMITLG